MKACLAMLAVLLPLWGCAPTQGTEPPPDGWANRDVTRVERVVDRAEVQLLEVRQGAIRTWVQVPDVGASAGDYVLLGRGLLREEVLIPETGERVRELVEIEHVAVVDAATAERTLRVSRPADAVAIAGIYDELETRADQEVVVYGTVVRAPHAIGSYWVHLQDGTGESAAGTHDLTVKTSTPVQVGQRIAFRGMLRADVDLGFGYHYPALVEDGVPVR